MFQNQDGWQPNRDFGQLGYLKKNVFMLSSLDIEIELMETFEGFFVLSVYLAWG